MANTLNTPRALRTPIAENATADNIMDIPDIYNPTTDYGVGGQDIGFPTECRLPIKNNDGTQGLGRAPKMQLFNGFFNAISSHNFFMQNGGMYSFNQTVSDKIGGYPQGAVLSYYDAERGLRFVRSLIANNTYNFNTNPDYIDGQKWEDVITTIGQVQSLLETIYPIGSIYLTVNAVCPLGAIFGTWQLVNSGKALWTGNGTNGGTSIAQELPQHTHENVHYHQRGTMEITGSFSGTDGYGASGAFTQGAKRSRYGDDWSDPDYARDTQTSFTASNNWTGGTSAPSSTQNSMTAKNSTGNVDNNSVYKTGGIVQPPAYVVNAFQRIA